MFDEKTLAGLQLHSLIIFYYIIGIFALFHVRLVFNGLCSSYVFESRSDCQQRKDVWTQIKNVIFVSNLTQITFGGCLKNDSNQISPSGASNHIPN